MQASEHTKHHANRRIGHSQLEQHRDADSTVKLGTRLHRFWRFLVDRPLV